MKATAAVETAPAEQDQLEVGIAKEGARCKAT
jgi:hypothetical protein